MYFQPIVPPAEPVTTTKYRVFEASVYETVPVTLPLAYEPSNSSLSVTRGEPVG